MQNNKSLRIAIADDEIDMRDFLRKVLPRLGHEVVAAAGTGAQLVADCRRTRPDLVITDLKMPDGDGIQATAEIWRDQDVPVIIISAFPQEIPDWLKSHRLLAAILVKPVKTSDLEPVIARIASPPAQS
jgi:two-component system, response regulator PdtaR